MRNSHALPKEILKSKMASPHAGGAHGFSQQTLERKLQNLTSSLQSIQAVAQWAIHYRRHAKTVVSVWYKELQKGEKLRTDRLKVGRESFRSSCDGARRRLKTRTSSMSRYSPAIEISTAISFKSCTIMYLY